MGYPIDAPIDVPLFCNIWTSFWNILISFTQLWRPWSQNEDSSRNLTGAKPRFCTIDIWNSPQENLILTLRYLCQNFRCHSVALIEVEPFHIVTHCYAASFLQKLILCEIVTVILPLARIKSLSKYFKRNKPKGQLSFWEVNIFRWFTIIGYTFQNTLQHQKLH